MAETQDELDINIREWMVVIVGTNVELSDEINKIYDKNEWEYYRASRTSFHYSAFFNRFTVIQERNIQKVLGIATYCYDNGKMDILLKLIKRGFRIAYSYVTQRRRGVSIDEFYAHYVKKKGGLEKVIEIDSINECIIVQYLCNLLDIPFNQYSAVGQLMDKHYRRTLMDMGYGREDIFFKLNTIDQKMVDKLIDYLKIPKDKTWNVGLWMENYIMVWVEENQKNYKTMEEFHKARMSAFQTGWMKYLGVYSGWVKVNGFEENTFFRGFSLTATETRILCTQILTAMKENSVEFKEVHQLFMSFIFMKSFFTDYKLTRDFVLTKQQDRMFDDLIKHEKEVQYERELLSSKAKEVNEKLAVVEKKEQSLREENKVLAKENKSLKQTVQEIEINKKELQALREYTFRVKENDEDYIIDQNEEDPLIVLKETKGALLGGHINLVNKLKRELPEFTYIRPENKNIDLSFIRNLDILFVYTSNLNHSIYERAMIEVEESDVTLYFIHGGTNLDYILTDMAEAVKDLE